MSVDEIISYCLGKNGAYVDFPFGDIPMCIKVANRLFAQIYPKPEDYKITLNCDRGMGEILRNRYPDMVVRGYHCPPILQPYFNTVYLNKGISDDELRSMIDHSYTIVVGKLPKKIRMSLSAKSE
jgi:predicted DNA-binding protein (MmcQ/YjbR family)